MRCPSTLSETRFNFSFFLITPAKKPRTECCCQSVAFMMASMVVPLDWRSRPITVSCLEERSDAVFAFEATGLAEAFGDFPVLGMGWPDRALGDFDFGFALRGAIWLS